MISEQIRLLNDKTTELDWYYSRPNHNLKSLTCDLLFMLFVNTPLHPPPQAKDNLTPIKTYKCHIYANMLAIQQKLG